MSRYKNIWEMRQGSPGTKGFEIFKCTDCGGETEPDEGFNGAPDLNNCFDHCKEKDSDWRPGNKQALFNDNFDRIFPDSPGAGI